MNIRNVKKKIKTMTFDNIGRDLPMYSKNLKTLHSCNCLFINRSTYN